MRLLAACDTSATDVRFHSPTNVHQVETAMISSLPEAAVAAELFAVLAPLDHRARERALTWLAVALEVDLSDVDPQMAFEAAQAVGLIENAP